MNDKTCANCVSRLLCPLKGHRQVCDGYNDEDVFWGFLSMIFPQANFPQMKYALEKINECAKEMRKPYKGGI